MVNLAKPEAEIVRSEQDPALVYLASLTETGRRSIISRLRKVARLIGADNWQAVPWAELRYKHVAAIRTALQEAGEAPASVNLALCALRRIAQEAFNLGLIDAEELARIKSVRSVRGERLLRGRALAPGELGALMSACANDETAAGIRDGALIALMYATGLRRAEVVALTVDDYNPDTGELKVRGKGNKERNLWIDNGAFDALADWLNIRGREPGALFVPIGKDGRLKRRKMTAQAVYKMLNKRAKQAGVKRFSPHDLRRSFISDQLDAGTDVITVQAMAGHASPTTTAKYDRRGDRAKQKAARALHIPYQRRTLNLAETSP